MAQSETEQPAIVVTGASSGIGREIARLAAGEGLPLVLVARSQAPLEELAGELRARGARAEALIVDLAATGGVATLCAALAQRGFHAEILVNNAGYGMLGPVAEADPAGQIGIVDLNVRAATELVLALLPGMVARGRGGVLNVASLASFFPGPNMAVYYASKAYLRSFSEALSREARGTGVAVTCLCPGPVKTGFSARAGLEGARLFRDVPVVDAREVARAGWEGLKAGRRVVVPGAANRLLASLSGLIPTPVKLSVAARLHKRRERRG